MSKVNYLLGFIKYLLNTRVSKLALIDNMSDINPKAMIYRSVKLYKTKIDAYSYVAPRSELLFVNIGKFCSIGRECLIGLPNHTLTNVSTSPIFTSRRNALKFTWTKKKIHIEFKEVTIKNDVWIGTRAIILGGVTIGDGAVIGAGAIVTKDIPDYAIAVGVPAKVIGYRFEDDMIKSMKKLKWWNLSDIILNTNIYAFQKENFNVTDWEEFIRKLENNHVNIHSNLHIQ